MAKAVIVIACIADAIIVDLSNPGLSLIWEIERFLSKPFLANKTVLFASSGDGIRQWASEILSTKEIEGLKRTLKDRQVLLKPKSWRRKKKFKTALRDAVYAAVKASNPSLKQKTGAVA